MKNKGDLDELVCSAVGDLSRRIERNLFEAMTANVPAPESEPLTMEKLQKAIDDLGPMPRRRSLYSNPFAPIPPPTFMDAPEYRPFLFPTFYGLQVMKPRGVIAHIDIDAPRWVRVPCLARGGRKTRRKVMRRVWT